ncbi:MAG TPA: TonB-dependent receptor [Rhizomicrobium sp.]|nr:TonB-dependent receptor [Rhizomicrobium sp.]
MPALAQADPPSPAGAAVTLAAPQAESNGSTSLLLQGQIVDSTAQDAEDLLSGVPNVNLLGYSANTEPPISNSISMRGLGSGIREGGISRALVTVDGVPLNDPFFGFIQWSRVPIGDIQRIQATRGGETTLWGNYAEGGVIAITTPFDMPNTAALDGEWGSFGTYRASASGAYPAEGDNTLLAFAETDGTGGYTQFQVNKKITFVVPTTASAVNVHVKDSFAPTPNIAAHMSLSYHADDQRFETRLEKNSQQDFYFSGDIADRVAPGAVLALNVFYGDTTLQSDEPIYSLDTFGLVPPTERPNEIHHVQTEDAGGALAWSQRFGGVLKSYLLGADWHFISGEDLAHHFLLPDGSRTTVVTRAGGDQMFVAGFAQVALSPVPDLDITAGARLQYLQNFRGRDDEIGGRGEVPDRAFTYVEPRVDARYALPAGFALRGAYARSYRAPNLGDEYYAHAADLFVQVENPLLKPERADGVEAGLDFARSGFHAQFTLYSTQVDDYIVLGRTTNPAYSPHGWFVTENQNAGSMRARGIEAEADWDIGAGFSAEFAYTLANSMLTRNTLDPVTVGQQLMDVPRHTESIGIAYASPQGARISIDAHRISKTSWFALVQNDVDSPNRSWAKANLVVDLYGSYPIGEKADLYAGIQNLFDRRYMAVGYSQPLSQVVTGAPLQAFMGLRLRFD